MAVEQCLRFGGHTEKRQGKQACAKEHKKKKN